jgi:nucleoside-diphosphate-sugar epimerase
VKDINIFCFGFGQVAKNFIKKLNKENFNITLSTTSRNKTEKKKFDNINYTSFEFNENKFDSNINERVKNSDHILISIPPKNGKDIVFKNFSDVIENANPKWITYLSATSVYGDHKGNWVTEKSDTRPSSSNGLDRLKAEKLWISLFNEKQLSLQVFRLSGIYSNENNTLVRLKSGNAKIINKENHFFSRVHVEDIANILFNSLFIFKPGEVFNVSDDMPASSKEVTLFGAKILGIEKPKTIEVPNIKSDTLKGFYRDSKKVSNEKMKVFFNYNLKFPTYVEGLNYIRNNFF